MPCTVGSLLREASAALVRAGIESASLDAQILLAHVLNTTREFVLIHNTAKVEQNSVAQFLDAVERRVCGEAVAYITHEKQFFNHKYFITSHVLVPRPETELLVEHALHYLKTAIKKNAAEENSQLCYHDTCTGSGCVGISIKAEIPELEVSVSDISYDALKVCKNNMQRILGYEIPCYQSDLLESVPGVFACITANPPYITTADTTVLLNSKLKEPRIALDGGDDGLLYYKRLIPQAYKKLTQGGMLFVEIGEDQGEAVTVLYKAHGFEDVIVFKDLCDHERIVSGVRL